MNTLRSFLIPHTRGSSQCRHAMLAIICTINFNQTLYSFSELGENTINHKSQGQMVWLWDFFLIFAKIYY